MCMSKTLLVSFSNLKLGKFDFDSISGTSGIKLWGFLVVLKHDFLKITQRW